jgi:hypothetical protein
MKDYNGVLREPIIIDDVGFATNIPSIGEQLTLRWCALFEHFGIDQQSKDGMFQLAKALAENHVPGFQEIPHSRHLKSKGGREKKWDWMKLIELWCDVEEKKRTGMSARTACSNLIKSSKTDRYKGQKLGTLYRRYVEAKSLKFLRIAKHAWANDLGVELGRIEHPDSGKAAEKLTPIQRIIATEILERS